MGLTTLKGMNELKFIQANLSVIDYHPILTRCKLNKILQRPGSMTLSLIEFVYKIIWVQLVQLLGL